MSYELQFIQALVCTVSAEVIMGWVLKRTLPHLFKIDLKTWLFCITVATATCLTLPYLWFVLPAFIHDRTPYIIIGEILVTLIEGLFYQFTLKLSPAKAQLFSLILNAFSFTLGLFIFK